MNSQKKTVIEASCPDCGGPLSEIESGKIVEFECMVGHRYSAVSVLNGHSASEEKALWAAVVAVEQAETLIDRAARFFKPELIGQLKQQAQHRKRIGSEIRKLIERLEPLRLEE